MKIPLLTFSFCLAALFAFKYGGDSGFFAQNYNKKSYLEKLRDISEGFPPGSEPPLIFDVKNLVSTHLGQRKIQDVELEDYWAQVRAIRKHEYESTAKKIVYLLGQHPERPLLYVAASYLFEHGAYRGGDRITGDYNRDALIVSRRFINESIRLGPNLAVAYYRKAGVSTILGQYGEAEIILDQLKRFAPYRGTSLSALARLYIAKGDHSSAIVLYETLLRRPKTSVEAAQNLAKLYRSSGNLKRAEFYYKKAIYFSKEDARQYHNYALFLKGLGRHQESILASRKALAKKRFPEALSSLSDTLAKLGRDELWQQNKYKKAREHFKEAMLLDANNQLASYGHAASFVVEAKLKSKPSLLNNARDEFRKHLDKFPHDKKARKSFGNMNDLYYQIR